MEALKRLFCTLVICFLWTSHWLFLGASEDCLSPLGMEDRRIKDDQLKATSSRKEAGPKYARLNQTGGYGGWCPLNKTSNVKGTSVIYTQFIQVTLDMPLRIKAISMQGREGGAEKVEQYWINYTPNRKVARSWKWIYHESGHIQYFKGNKDTLLQRSMLKPPIIADRIRLAPLFYSNTSVCMRFELLGCQVKNGLVAYAMPQGSTMGARYNFTDSIYDGLTKDSFLSSGLGFLTDGRPASADFVDGNGLGWIGWDAKNTPAPYIVFKFLDTRIFHHVTIHCNVRDQASVKLFSKLEVSFSEDGVTFNASVTKRPKAVTSGTSWINRNVTIDLCRNTGKSVQLNFSFAGDWILISEVTFESVPLGSKSPPDVFCTPVVIPPTLTVPSKVQSFTTTTSPSHGTTVDVRLPEQRPGLPEQRPAIEWYYIVGPLSAVVLSALIVWFICKRRMTARARSQGAAEEHEMEVLNVEMDSWEIARRQIALEEVIGSGAFGTVWRATLSRENGKPGIRFVAAKCFSPTSGDEGKVALMREIGLGKLIGDSPQPNIVQFIGCVTTQIQPILIMEYLPCGDLLGYLRKSRGIFDKHYCGKLAVAPLKTYDLMSFSNQIATGMVFLASRGIIHRDLAARNVLLDQNRVCKVTDFGLSYQNFKYGHGNAKKGCMPIKWTAPEILFGDPANLSSKSDVWSYGVVLYEIFTIGGIPYPGWSEGKTMEELKRRYRMPKPAHVASNLYNLMKMCWEEIPVLRPDFVNISKRLRSFIEGEYLPLVDESKYDGAKYSGVEDVGAETEGDARAVRGATNAKASTRKWSSLKL